MLLGAPLSAESLPLAVNVFFCRSPPQSSSSKASKELPNPLEDAEEERQARQDASEELFKLEGDVADLRSEEKRLKARLGLS